MIPHLKGRLESAQKLGLASPGKGAFYYINHHNSSTFSGLPDSTARNFEAS